ncbi:hypothetical protein C6499_21355 [Candidatus Poribacteria bacterium]|nr:MAG: hypothetical protein C6499_21355 [Candidatus Poribacteria bacterium]
MMLLFTQNQFSTDISVVGISSNRPPASNAGFCYFCSNKGDPESLHIYPVKEGLSQKSVDPDAVPVFEEQIPYRSVLTQVMLLVLFNLLFFIVALVSFLKSDLK